MPIDSLPIGRRSMSAHVYHVTMDNDVSHVTYVHVAGVNYCYVNMNEASNILSKLSNTLMEQAERLKELSGQEKPEGCVFPKKQCMNLLKLIADMFLKAKRLGKRVRRGRASSIKDEEVVVSFQCIFILLFQC